MKRKDLIRENEGNSRSFKQMIFNWRSALALLVGIGLGVWYWQGEMADPPLWPVMLYIPVALMFSLWIIPRIVWMHLFVIGTGIMLTQLPFVSESDHSYAGFIVLGMYALSVGSEMRSAARPSKQEGREKLFISCISLVIWTIFMTLYVVAWAEQQRLDTAFWETIMEVKFLIVMAGLLASIIEIPSTIFIAIESRTTEDYIRADDARR